jgi:argininosuccinate lyase
VAGTSVPLDRAFTARLLGFYGVWDHALDATSARDHLIEALSAVAIQLSNLSRLAGDVIWLAGPETAVFEYPDGLADTSSAMPQKKNPDPLELLRGRAAAAGGALGGALGIVHGLPAGYSRDLQEMKPLLWRALEHAGSSALVARLVVEGIRVRPGRAAEILDRGFAAALDLAEVLSLGHGVPFRRAHFAVGRLVRSLGASGRTFARCGAAEASAALSAAAARPVRFTEAQWREAVSPAAGAARRRTRGGPGDGVRLLRTALARQRALDAAVRRAAAREERARLELRRTVARAA